MNEEIPKLAIKCEWPEEAGEPECGSLNIEAFYRAAYNKALDEAGKVSMNASKRMDDRGCIIADQIRALEMK